MNKKKLPVIEDERTELIELKTIRFATLSTFIIIFIISISVILSTKSMDSIIWPVSILVVFYLSFSLYSFVNADRTVPYTSSSLLFHQDYTKEILLVRLLYYIADAFFMALITIIFDYLGKLLNIAPLFGRTSSLELNNLSDILITILSRIIVIMPIITLFMEIRLRRYRNQIKEGEHDE